MLLFASLLIASSLQCSIPGKLGYGVGMGECKEEGHKEDKKPSGMERRR